MKNFEFFTHNGFKKVKVQNGFLTLNKTKMKVISSGPVVVKEVFAFEQYQEVQMLDFLELETLGSGGRTILKDVFLEKPQKDSKVTKLMCRAILKNKTLVLIVPKECSFIIIFNDVDVEGEGSWNPYIAVDKGINDEILLNKILSQKPTSLSFDSNMEKVFNFVTNKNKPITLHLDTDCRKFVELAYDRVSFYLTKSEITLEIKLETSNATGLGTFDLVTPLQEEPPITQGYIEANRFKQLCKVSDQLSLKYLEGKGWFFCAKDSKTGGEFSELIQQGVIG